MPLKDRLVRVRDALLRDASPATGLPRTPLPLLRNTLTGMGGQSDKLVGAQFVPQLVDEPMADVLYTQSWAAAKMIDIPVDDIWMRGRQWTGDDEAQTDKLQNAVRELKAHRCLEAVMKAGRLYGSAALIIAEKGKGLETELVPEAIPAGGIANLIVVNRWQMPVYAWGVDPRVPGYGQPYLYRFQPRLIHGEGAAPQTGQPQGDQTQRLVHHTRVLRFDGRRSTLTEGWRTTLTPQRDWGVSELTPAIEEIIRDAASNAGVGHLIQEGSIFVMKVRKLRSALTGQQVDPETPDIQVLGAAVNMFKSLYRTLFIDQADEAERVNAVYTGLADLLNIMTRRLSAIADIPETRFMGQSPAG